MPVIKGGSRGFTMIELLVVISVIGVLAVAVLSSINPIEQINKGRDTRTRSDAAQLINASERYFAIQEYYPWNAANTDSGYTPAANLDVQNDETNYETTFDFDGTAGTGWGWTENLTETDEVKPGFASRLENDESLYVYKGDSNSDATIYGCFLPRSQAFRLEAANRCQDTDFNQINGGNFCDTTNGDISQDNWLCIP